MPIREGTYAALLRDPRWQRRRLEIMSRDNFACRDCGNDEETLNVHHLYYRSSFAPWEYSDSALVTWCEPCHEYFSLTGERRTKTELANDWRLGEDLIYEALCEYGATPPSPSVIAEFRHLLPESAILAVVNRLAWDGRLNESGALVSAVQMEAGRA